MAIILERPEIFNAQKDFEYVVEPDTPLISWLLDKYPKGFKGLGKSGTVYLNNVPLTVDQYGVILKEKDQVIVELYPLDAVTITAIVITTVISVASFVASQLLVPTPKLPNSLEQPERSPTYSLNAQRNQARTGEIIQRPFGRFRYHPPLAAVPFFQFNENDEQILYQLYCLGPGTYDVHDIKIGETDVNNIDGVEVEIYEPGQQVTLYPGNVRTSQEISNLQLIDEGTDPTETGWTNWFVVNEVGTLCYEIEFDVVFQGGLFFLNNDGSYSNITVNLRWEIRRIDNNGDPVTPEDITEFNANVLENDSSTVRRSFRVSFATPGRFEARGRRIGNKDTRSGAQNDATWTGMKAFIQTTDTYDGLTMVAMRAVSSQTTSGALQDDLNISATAKLPIYDGTSWSAPVPTRNPAWAFAELFRASYAWGGSDTRLDLDRLVELAAVWETRNDYFDGIFDNQITAWEAFTTTLRSGRAQPVLISNTVTVIRDEPQAVAKQLFTHRNIVKNSYKETIKFDEEKVFDGVRGNFKNSFDWKDDFVITNENAENPKVVDLFGITQYEQAWREVQFIESKRNKTFKFISFETEMEGHILLKGDKIKVAPPWNRGEFVDEPQAGEILDFSGSIVYTSEPLSFDVGQTHEMHFRALDGSILATREVTANGTDKYSAIVVGAMPALNIDPDKERTHYSFGTITYSCEEFLISEINPVKLTRVRIKAELYDETIYTADTGTPPVRNLPGFPLVDADNGSEINDLRMVTIRSISAGDGPQYEVNLSWKRAPTRLLTSGFRDNTIDPLEAYEVFRSLDGGTSYIKIDETLNRGITLITPVSDTGEVCFRVEARYSRAKPVTRLDACFFPAIPDSWNARDKAVTITANYQAKKSDFLILDVTAGGFTVTLPAAAAINDRVVVIDVIGDTITNNVIFDPGSLLIEGDNKDIILNINTKVFSFVYTGSSNGWSITGNG